MSSPFAGILNKGKEPSRNMVAVPASQCWNFKNPVGRGLLHRPASVGILEQSMWARNRIGRGLSYRPASAGILEQSMGS
jgi:hypothetical protein